MTLPPGPPSLGLGCAETLLGSASSRISNAEEMVGAAHALMTPAARTAGSTELMCAAKVPCSILRCHAQPYFAGKVTTARLLGSAARNTDRFSPTAFFTTHTCPSKVC